MASFLTRGEDALGARGEENDEQAATAWALLPPNPRGECANSRVPSETSHGAAGLDHPARGPSRARPTPVVFRPGLVPLCVPP